MKLFNIRAELRVLRGMCSSDAAVAGTLLAKARREFFHLEETRGAYDYIVRRVRATGSPPDWDLVTSTKHLTDATKDVLKSTRLKEFHNASQADAVIEELFTIHTARSVYNGAKKLIDDLAAAESFDQEHLVKCTSALNSAAQGSVSQDDAFTSLGVESDVLDAVKELIYGESTDVFIPTGLKHFDDTNAGMPRGGVVLIGGQTSVGKSHVVTQFAAHQATLGYKVVVVPLEMSREEMLNRLLAHTSKIDSLRILRKKLTTAEKDQVYKSFRVRNRKMEKNGGRLSIFNPKEDLTMEQVLNACNSYSPDVIYIDYIGLLGGLDGEDQWRAMSNAVRMAKVYAGKTGRIVALAAQVSEEGQIRYSKAMKEHASLMFTLTANERDRESNRVQVRMDKGRNQIMYNFPLHVDYSTSTMREYTPEEIEAHTAKDRVEAVRRGGNGAKADTKTHATDELDDYTPPKRSKPLSQMTESELADPANQGALYGYSTLDGIEDNPDFKPTDDNLRKAGISKESLPERRARKERRDEVPDEQPRRRRPARVTEG